MAAPPCVANSLLCLGAAVAVAAAQPAPAAQAARNRQGAPAAQTAPATRAPQQQFAAPAPGSYRLPVIQQAADGRVLDSDGRLYALRRYTHDRITLLSFMYTYCSDALGCPLAYAVLAGLHERLQRDPALAARVRLVSLSFDPVNDTPVMMRSYGGHYARPDSLPRWHFLTTRTLADLRPIVDDFGQAVAVQYDLTGKPMRLYHHMLKVYLLDVQGRVREIYSPAFLLPAVVFNDIVTLDREQRGIR